MAQSPIGPVYEILPYRPSLYGKFTVNLGVWIPEVGEYHLGNPRGKTVHEYDCQIRARLGVLMEPPADRWWVLDDDWPESAGAVLSALEESGLPFLDRFRSREAICEEWVEYAEPRGLGPTSRLVVAIIHAVAGRKDAAQLVFTDHYLRTTQEPHREYLGKLAGRLGFVVPEPAA